MAEIGLRSGKVKAGLYKVGPYELRRERNCWYVWRCQSDNTKSKVWETKLLVDAINWCRAKIAKSEAMDRYLEQAKGGYSREQLSEAFDQVKNRAALEGPDRRCRRG